MREFKCQRELQTSRNIRFLASDAQGGTLFLPDYNRAKFGREENPIWDLSGIVLGLR
jgi:hypothetical protein